MTFPPTSLIVSVFAAFLLVACGSDASEVSSADVPDGSEVGVPVEPEPSGLPFEPSDPPVEPEPSGLPFEPSDPPVEPEPSGLPFEPSDPPVEPEPSELPVEPEPAEPGPLGGGGTLATIDIVITHPDADDVTYTISCLGDTATIIGDVALDDFAACKQLGDDGVRERLLNGPPVGLSCTQIYGGPDVATLRGTYDGVDGPAVDTTVDRTDGCGIGEWDSLLSQVLPGALGVQ